MLLFFYQINYVLYVNVIVKKKKSKTDKK